MTQKKRPISIIIPFYMELERINKTIESIFNQDYWDEHKTFEVLLCNDGPFSSEEIRSHIANEYHYKISIISNAGPKGPGPARNVGIENASFSTIAFLDADDTWRKDKISLQAKEIEKGFNFIPTGYYLGAKHKISPPKSIKNPIDIYTKRGIGSSTVILKTEVIGSKRFTDLRYSQDIEFWYKIAKDPSFNYTVLNEPLVNYSDQGSTQNKFIQLVYFYKSMQRNRIAFHQRLLALISYIIIGISNHYLRK